MKVKIGPYKNWFGPYQLADALCFWVKEVEGEFGLRDKPEWVHKFGEWLAHGSTPDESNKPRYLRLHKERPETWLYKLLSWIDSKKKRKISVHIDRWDTWSMDSTLALIILPMLKQLKATKHGSGFIELEDVPEHLRSTNTEEYDQQLTFNFYRDTMIEEPNIHTRFDWALDEMIWAFEQLQPDCDWEAQYHSGEFDMYWEVSETDDNDRPKLYQMKHGPDETYKTDMEGLQKHQARIDNGLRLFGKYYRTLWD